MIMTMIAQRVDNTSRIKVGITYGPVTTSIEEEAGHLRYFHNQLGQLLEQYDEEVRIKNATPSD